MLEQMGNTSREMLSKLQASVSFQEQDKAAQEELLAQLKEAMRAKELEQIALAGHTFVTLPLCELYAEMMSHPLEAVVAKAYELRLTLKCARLEEKLALQEMVKNIPADND